ncbi:PREDICTED: bifunctional protein PutA-like [Trachymyrmex cornetzi]|uniref:bifunctional protein PutA-like n=1 Tax=Trachymyrmex cornetzi TaxID=471704 RepID=UPI00084F217A|nr:PREDICTED: bifunctional protein PutA-like [Trachymyrmex cornetzi]
MLKFNELDFDVVRLIGKFGKSVVSKIFKKAVNSIANTFIMGDFIKSGVENAKRYEKNGQRVSYDILGESSRNIEQVESYYSHYLTAVDVVAGDKKWEDCYSCPSISVKLSALHPRFELLQRERVFRELLPRVENIVRQCAAKNISVTFDAEEANRLDMYLALLTKFISSEEFSFYNGIGFVVQVYQKRAFPGAYWDFEVKNAQELGLVDYPVFTCKEFTDISYLACAKKILAHKQFIYPQFATHNAYTSAAIQDMGDKDEFEFQKLHGMGDVLHDIVIEQGYISRIYAPVGAYHDLLAYLMRRLLENGAIYTSFLHIVHRKCDSLQGVEMETHVKATTKKLSVAPKIPMPQNIFSSGRLNSIGYDMGFVQDVDVIRKSVEDVSISALVSILQKSYKNHCIEGEENIIEGGDSKCITVKNPADSKEVLARLRGASIKDVERALESAHKYFDEWAYFSVEKRAEILDKIADLMHHNRHTLYALLIREAGKNIKDCIGEGTSSYVGANDDGLIYSPWNFPLAIFCGQIFAALVCGNTVITKPSELTSLIALYTVDLMRSAGVSDEALHLLLGADGQISRQLTTDNRVSGVCFTGSTVVARSINVALASRNAPIATLIAETGGQNAMIIDSSALLEQSVDAILLSAFGSIGQRCTALRVLYVQEKVYGPLLRMLSSALQEIKIGNTLGFSNDLGPVISVSAKNSLEAHVERMQNNGFKVTVWSGDLESAEHKDGYFIAPCIIEINSIHDIKEENFSPILHVIPYQAKNIDNVIAEINSTGFRLTFGMQSRIERNFRYVASKIKAGNIYMNRSTTGAQVESHPFGGEGNSGTGFKAGGPNYLLKFVTERTLTINTTAVGGNFKLLSESFDNA